MATRLADARLMLDTCAQQARILAINHHLRGAATHGRMREVIAEGAIGTPQAAHVSFPVLLPEELRTWRLDAAADGGVLFDIGTHCIDLLRWLLGAEIRQVGCFAGQQTFRRGAEDAAVATLGFDTGCLATLYMAYNAPHGVMTLDVQGSRGSLRAVGTLEQVPQGQVYLSDDAGDRQLPVRPVDLYEQHVAALCAAVTGDGQPLAGGQDGYRSLEAALALRAAAATRSVVSLGSHEA
jgi:1,5-anhydro-D-fructose reductase (1,5-anhydro-D-mannitol-forming)